MSVTRVEPTRRREVRTLSVAFVVPLIFLPPVLSGCHRDEQTGKREVENAPAAEPQSTDIGVELDRLRALPYVDWSPNAADEDNSGVVVFDRNRSYPGYNLYTVRLLCRTDLIDSRGRVIHSWQPGTIGRWVRSLLLPNGDLLVVGIDDAQRFVMRLSWEGEVVWKRFLPSHHDIAPTPDNRLMLLTFKLRPLPDISPDYLTRDDHITVLSQSGEIIEERSIHDILSSRPDLFTFMQIGPAGTSIDLIHANSVRWLTHKHLEARSPIYAPTNVIVCSRHQNTVAIFNWETRELVWAWGQGEIIGPHDASVLENGNILLFDNRLGQTFSRVIELDPLTENIVWEYKAPNPPDFFTGSRGGNQRLPNGNTLITESDEGRAFEVTPQGEIVWEYLVPYLNEKQQRATIIRLYRYENDFVERIIEMAGKSE